MINLNVKNIALIQTIILSASLAHADFNTNSIKGEIKCSVLALPQLKSNQPTQFAVSGNRKKMQLTYQDGARKSYFLTNKYSDGDTWIAYKYKDSAKKSTVVNFDDQGDSLILDSITFKAKCPTYVSSKKAPACDYAGMQKILRDSANALHSGNPVRYIDFANDAPFSVALDRMHDVGVSEIKVEAAWLKGIQASCGVQASHLTVKNVGPNQTLGTLMALLKAK